MGQVYEKTTKDKQIARTSIFGLDAPGATQLYPLGTEIMDDIGDAFGTTAKRTKLRYVQASGAILVNAHCSYADASGSLTKTMPASLAGMQSSHGVAPYAFADQQFGWLAIEGYAKVLTSSSGHALGDMICGDSATANKVKKHTVAGAFAQLEVQEASCVIGTALAAESAGIVEVALWGH